MNFKLYFHHLQFSANVLRCRFVDLVDVTQADRRELNVPNGIIVRFDRCDCRRCLIPNANQIHKNHHNNGPKDTARHPNATRKGGFHRIPEKQTGFKGGVGGKITIDTFTLIWS